MVTVPNVSTVGNFLMIACRLAIRKTPKARVTVTTIGKPSGMAATARLQYNTIQQTVSTRTEEGSRNLISPRGQFVSPDTDGEHLDDRSALYPSHEHDRRDNTERGER